MSSLGELFFTLGLDDKKFNDAIEAAKKRVADLSGDITIGINADVSNVKGQVQAELDALQGKKTSIKTDVSIDTTKIENLKARLKEAEEEAKKLGEAFDNATSEAQRVALRPDLWRAKDRVIDYKNRLAEYGVVDDQMLKGFKGTLLEAQSRLKDLSLEYDEFLEKIRGKKRLSQEEKDSKNFYEHNIAGEKEIIADYERLIQKAAEYRAAMERESKAVSEANKAIQDVAQPSRTIQHVVREEDIELVNKLTSALEKQNEQLEVQNRLQEGRQRYNAEQKEEKERLRNEKKIIEDTTREVETLSKAWMDVSKVKRDQANEQYQKRFDDAKAVSEAWMSAAKNERNSRIKAETAEVKSAKKELKEQLASLYKIEEAIRKLQTMRLKLDLSGIDQTSEGYRNAAKAIDDYIEKLQELQGSGARIAKKGPQLDLNQGMREVTMTVNNEIAAQKRIDASIKKLVGGEDAVTVTNKKVTAMQRLQKAIIGTTNWASQLNNQLGNAISIYSIERFVTQLYTVGGEFQKQQIALRNMLGDASKADVVFERVKDLSVKSPFTFSELASYTKQMSAYGLEYEELYDTTKRLADISAGVGVDMGRLILAYGQVRSAEVLRGQELRQFTEAGIPLVAELAKRLEEVRGKSVKIGEVFDAISKREISFGMVKDVLFDMTDPGGRFFQTQEQLAESLAGKWSNMKDAWDIMMADIANGNNSTLKNLADLSASILRNWEAWLPAIVGIVSAFGSYRTIMSLIIPLQQTFNVLTKANPWIALATAIVGAGVAIYGYATNTKTAAEEFKELNREIDKNIQKNRENEQTANRYLESLKAQNTSEERRIKLYQELERMYPEVFESMGYEKTMLEDLITLKEKLAGATKKQSLAEYDNEILKNQNEINRLRREDFRRLTTPGRGDKHAQNDSRIKELESISLQLQESRDALAKELEWKGRRDALSELSTLQDYLDVYGEVGKAIKVLKEGGITEKNLVSPDIAPSIHEMNQSLRSALAEQEKIKKDFAPTSDTHKNADRLATIYKNAILAINGVLETEKPQGESESEKRRKEEGKRAAKAFADGVREELNRVSSQWDLYKQLFEATGDKTFAMTAFNVTPVWDEASREMLDKFKEELHNQGFVWDIDFDLSDTAAKEVYGDLYDSWKAIKDRIEKNGIELKVNTANAIKETMSIEDKIDSLTNQMNADLSVREGLFGKDSIEYISAAENWKKQIQDLKTELWELSPAFKDVFKDTVGMSIGQIEKLKKETQSIIDAINDGTPNEKTGMIDFTYGGKNYSTDEEGLNKLIELLDKLSEKSQTVGDNFRRVWSYIAGKEYEGQGKLKFGDIVGDLASIASGASEAAQSLSSMFDALGDDGTALSFELAGDLFGGVSKIGQGIAAKDPFAVLGGVTGIITSIAQHHDKKLDRAIQKSQLEVEKLANQYKNLERELERQLGAATAGQAAKMIDSLKNQREELRKQYELEDDKKKTDQSKLEDYKQQISELDDQIKHFYRDLASEQYGVDIKGWAGQIADALTDAFAKGEDAAVAFEKSVSDILSGLVKEMISMNVIMPAFKQLEDYLFKEGTGIFALGSAGGTSLTEKEAASLADRLGSLSSTIGDAQKIWDAINEASNGALENVEGSASGLPKGTQSVTEDTADLLASYVNGMRADLSMNRTLIEQLVSVDVPKMSYLAEAQLQQLQMVVANTKRNADAADRIYDLVNRVVDKGSNKLKV